MNSATTRIATLAADTVQCIRTGKLHGDFENLHKELETFMGGAILIHQIPRALEIAASWIPPQFEGGELKLPNEIGPRDFGPYGTATPYKSLIPKGTPVLVVNEIID